MRRSLWISALVMLISLCVLNNMAQAQQTPLLIGSVNLLEVIPKHPVIADEMPRISQAFEKEVKEHQAFAQSLAKQGEDLKNTYKVGTNEFEAQLRPIRDKLREAESQMLEKKSQVVNQLNKMQYRVYTDISKAIQTVSEQKGIIVALLRQKPVDRKNIPEEVAGIREFESNTVIWIRPECDITNDVIAVLAQMVGTPKTTDGGALSNISGGLVPSGPAPAAVQPTN